MSPHDLARRIARALLADGIVTGLSTYSDGTPILSEVMDEAWTIAVRADAAPVVTGDAPAKVRDAAQAAWLLATRGHGGADRDDAVSEGWEDLYDHGWREGRPRCEDEPY